MSTVDINTPSTSYNNNNVQCLPTENMMFSIDDSTLVQSLSDTVCIFVLITYSEHFQAYEVKSCNDLMCISFNDLVEHSPCVFNTTSN